MFRKIHFALLAAVYLLASVCIRDAETVTNPRRSDLKLAAWNIRILSDSSRTDTDLHKIAKTLIDYDFIAISELRDEKVLKRLQRILSGSGAEYGYQISEPVGRVGSSHKEHYAFLYYKGLVSVVTDGELYPDAADGKDDFVRDPYWATFSAGKFDFSVIAVHEVGYDPNGRNDQCVSKKRSTFYPLMAAAFAALFPR